MAKATNQISQSGYEKLLAEINTLKDKDIPETLEVMKDAREQWDLSENADYHAAKDKLSLLRKRLTELENMIKSVDIVDGTQNKATWEMIEYGSKVSLEIEGDKAFDVEIVWSGEVSVGDTLAISLDSPLGKALSGKSAGTQVEMRLPAGNKKVKILSVS